MESLRRLTSATDFQRVRREGRSLAHPLFVLIACKNDLPVSRVGVAASQSLGSAVQRNRAKRRLREAVRAHRPRLHAGWDLVCIARKPILAAKFAEVRAVMQRQLERIFSITWG